ncbi:hypothetical protein [Chiayiivirga flava]|uniref:Tetratricopeptide repeat protein n=1 Tax=Chiayiivirga flava TaxID=659595 RepID=A0A7W8D6U0_9GAMM|nr:hypothetical protein [Chiayiivirga flava]MBB5208975.1 hypothetical protein [Chiayiivirga flava]
MSRATAGMCAAFIVAALIYSAGLPGPFLFDDAVNLQPIKLWLDGEASWFAVVSGNESGALGRPVAMATFTLSALAGGVDPFAYKTGNLLIHLLTATAIWLLLRIALQNDSQLSRHAAGLAALLTAIWVLHPLHVSTVLYVVQRMAQLSSLFVLLGLCAYLRGRALLAHSEKEHARWWLFLFFPLMWGLGMLSKENAAVASSLCLVFEAAYFSGHRPKEVKIFFILFLALPLAAGLLMFAWSPRTFLGGYEFRDFTLYERLLSQGRALVEYIGMTAVPRGRLMGVYTDDFAISKGLLSPPGTVWCWMGIATTSWIAVAVRKHLPGFFAGWFFFVVAHGVESTVLPLELYYEHRNYLPSVGLLLAAASVFAWLIKRARVSRTRAILVASLSIAYFAGLATTTLSQAFVWTSKRSIVQQAYENRPQSLRARQERALWALSAYRAPEALEIFANIANSERPRERLLGSLDQFSVQCVLGTGADARLLSTVRQHAPERLTVAEAQSAMMLYDMSDAGRCRVPDEDLAATIDSLVGAAANQDNRAPPKNDMLFLASKFHARAGQWDAAAPLAVASYRSIPRLPVGQAAVRYLERSGQIEAAQALRKEMRERGPA